MAKKPDFSGWVTRANLKCSDGRTIGSDAFADQDGSRVPLVWNHQHDAVNNVLGYTMLHSVEGSMRGDCFFNDTESGETAKRVVEHGDVFGLSICANQLKEDRSTKLVKHGIIREVSLVLAGANPGAYIDEVALSHSDEGDTLSEAIIYTGTPIFHSDEKAEEKEEPKEDKKEEKKEEKKPEAKDDDEKTVEDVLSTLNEQQKIAVGYVLGRVIEDGASDKKENGGKEEMKQNVFDKDVKKDENVITHSDQLEILDAAKGSQFGGSFKAALEAYAEDKGLQHDAIASGFVQTGDGNVTQLFPEYKEVRPGAPELITNDQGWISVVMRKVHKSPISRIRTSHVDIRGIDALRAKGYVKGKEKAQTGNFSLVRRTTDPQTVYVKNALHRDDIVDITDFDYVKYLYDIDRMMLNEELATAIMLGDGREDGAEDKIEATHIRPIWTDDDLYTLHVDIDLAAMKSELQGTDTGTYFGENYIAAEAMINTCLYAREKFKGTGTPDMFITPHKLNVMLLARDRNGRRIFSGKAELASALNVGEIVTAEQFEGKTRTDANGNTKNLVAIIANLADYSLGATKGGEITHFTQFDLKFNQQISLLETRCSGALTRVYSAIAIEEAASTSSDTSTTE